MSESTVDTTVTTVADVGGVVTSAVRRSLDAGEELGVQVAAVVGGRTVVHVAGGWREPQRRDPVSPDALFPMFSATKGVVAAAVLALLDADAFGLDEPVRRVWPEVAAHGKQDLTLRHILTHTAGVPQMPDDTTVERMCDWDAMVAAVADLTPLWTPGSRVAYHAYTYGWLAGEVLRRVDGSGAGVDALVRYLVLGPAAAEDVWLGVPPPHEHRVVDLAATAGRDREDAALFRRAIPEHLDTGPQVYGRSDVRQACLPGAGAVGTALALARVYDHLAAAAPDSWTARGGRIHEERPDAVVGRPVPRGLGFWVSGSTVAPQDPPLDGGPGRFGHPGAGGSIAWADTDLGAGFAVLRNGLTAPGWRDPSVQRIVAATIAAVRAALPEQRRTE